MNRLAHHQGIHKFFMTLGLALDFSKPILKHLVHIVDALTTKGFSGTLTDVHHWSFHPNHRTTLSHFFTKSPWNEEKLLEKLQEWVLRQIKRLTQRTNQPLFLSIDDTICQKTKPSSRAIHAIQGCHWHFSHKDHRSVWGHSLVWLMVHTFTQAGEKKQNRPSDRDAFLAQGKIGSVGVCAHGFVVSVQGAHRSLPEKGIPCYRHAQDESNALSERHRHPSEGVCPLYRAKRHPPRHSGRRALPRVSL